MSQYQPSTDYEEFKNVVPHIYLDKVKWTIMRERKNRRICYERCLAIKEDRLYEDCRRLFKKLYLYFVENITNIIYIIVYSRYREYI